jgi:class 3 adenylate cyclase
MTVSGTGPGIANPNDIANLLVDRESRKAERRIGLIRMGLLAVGLFVLMPVRYVQYGVHQGSGNLWVVVSILAAGFAGSAVLVWRLRAPDFPRHLALFGISLDFGILAALTASQGASGFYPAVRQSIETYTIFLPFALVMNALTGLRFSLRQVVLSGFLCLAVILEAALIDCLQFGAPFYAVTIGVLVSLAVGTTVTSYFQVAKARGLLSEAASIEFEAVRVRNALSRYVSAPVAEMVLRENLLETGEGRRERVTVLFSDIRGFTKLSETMPPESVVSLLNRYFSRMVRVVFLHEGMLDKYIGDGMMVIFGAPVQCDDHALHAVHAALEMRQELEKLNEELESQGQKPLSIGIGIHTGECVIGNIGTEQRLDYTAIGDTVNTTSRIEGLTKEYGVDILISAETFAEVQGKVEAAHLPQVAIRGRTASLDLFVLKGLQAPESRDKATRRLTRFLW